MSLRLCLILLSILTVHSFGVANVAAGKCMARGSVRIQKARPHVMALMDSGVAPVHVSPIAAMIRKYNDLTVRHPFRMQLLSSAVIGATSDLLGQVVSRPRGQQFVFDSHRNAVFTAVSTIYFAPVIGWWFSLLNRIPLQANSLKKAMTMMLVDQSVGSLLINSGFFFVLEMVYLLLSPREWSMLSVQNALTAGRQSLATRLMPTLIANWYCWPIANFINFRFVPENHRLLFSNIVAIFWNVYLSLSINK